MELTPYTPSQQPQPDQKPSSETTIQELVEILRTVDIKNPDAILNATTISDGKGGRILL